MFSKEALMHKEKTFLYSQQTFKSLNEVLNDDDLIIADHNIHATIILFTIAKFMSYKEDVWKKNKKTKIISTNFSKEILDKFIFEGKFTTAKIGSLNYRERKSLTFKPPIITKILSGKEKDSAWIIDNIRDSIAHGHYYIDFDNKQLYINNEHEDRILECSICFDALYNLTELVTKERIGGYTDKKLTTVPIVYRDVDKSKPLIITFENINQLKIYLKNEFCISYSQITEINEPNIDKRYKDLLEFYNFNVRMRDALFTKLANNPLKRIDCLAPVKEYIRAKMQNYQVETVDRHLTDHEIDVIIKLVLETPTFFKKTAPEQGTIIAKILQVLISGEEFDIEQGITDIIELYDLANLEHHAKTPYDKKFVKSHLLCNGCCFPENRKLANLFVLGLNNFVSNKESVFDNYFDDYSKFDIHSFNYQDYSRYNKLISTLKILNEDLKNTNNSLAKADLKIKKLQNNLTQAPEAKKQIIQNNIDNLNNLINSLNKKINDLIAEIAIIENIVNNCHNDLNGKYVCDSNKSFFNHLRNAFAHGHIKYSDERVVPNRKILLEDYDDNGNLSFKCECRYFDLVKLFNNELFLEAIKSDEKVLIKKN